MGGNAEVAGLIQVEICYSESDVNEWLKDHPDTEVVDIKFTASSWMNQDGVHDSLEHIMIIYRKED